MLGFLNLNKPYGLTSHDCVARVRKLLRLKRVGHGGTLDPAATGVLPIALGKATRLLAFLPEEKAYRATIRLGVRTATDDLQGETIRETPAGGLDLAAVKTALDRFVGTIEQVPPAYSAIQVGGKRLYDLARAGEKVEVPVRTVRVESICFLDWRSRDFPELDVEITCGPGTYIRAIARDLGEALGTGGTLAALERTSSCGFSLGDSLSLEALGDRIERGLFRPVLPDTALQRLPSVCLPDDLAWRWCQGQRFAWSDGPEGAIVRVRSAGDKLLGIACLQNDCLVQKVVLETTLSYSPD